MHNEVFASLFSGLKRAYGLYKDRGKTIRKPVSILNYQEHLAGKKSLGIVPINEENKCYFGAIDIDINDIDHIELARRLEGKGVIVCRSKSGGAHIYGFCDGRIKASKMRAILSDIASALGYGTSEIFPKQDRLNPEDVGNWINLPYFGGEDTTRYGVDTNGKMTLDSFLEEATRIVEGSVFLNANKAVENYRGMPPCLRHFMDNGIPAGSRNEVIYNLGVYYKKKGEDHWEDKLYAANHDLMAKPLPAHDIDTIIKSLKRKEYNYKCDNVLQDYCNKAICHNIAFGARIPEINYDEVPIGRLQKIDMDPPRWVIDVEGHDVDLDTRSLWDYKLIRLRVMEVCHKIIKPVKQERWLKELQKRLSQLEIIEAPKEASKGGQIVGALNEFLMLHTRARSREDVYRGLPVRGEKQVGAFKEDIVMFRGSDFHAFLKRKRIPTPASDADFWMIMRKCGCNSYRTTVKGKTINAWYVRYDGEHDAPILDPIPDEIEM